MVTASTPSANEPAKGLILVHTVKLKPMIKAQISGRMVSSSISVVAFASVSEKTRLKKLMIIITSNNKTLGRAQDPRANGAWLSKLTE